MNSLKALKNTNNVVDFGFHIEKTNSLSYVLKITKINVRFFKTFSPSLSYTFSKLLFFEASHYQKHEKCFGSTTIKNSIDLRGNLIKNHYFEN